MNVIPESGPPALNVVPVIDPLVKVVSGTGVAAVALLNVLASTTDVPLALIM